jgi:Domain of unknown function (DUF4292)
MKNSIAVVVLCCMLFAENSCRSTKKLQTAVNKKDTTIVTAPAQPVIIDTLRGAEDVLKSLNKNKIDFKTFSAKIKVQYEDYRGKQPDFNAFIRLYKDSVLWVSINATFLSIEAFRILITKNNITILNKLDKKVEYHNFNYIEDVAHIPLTFSTLQDLVVGNPVYIGDSIVSYRQTENHILLGTVSDLFKNLLTISADNDLLERSKLDDIDLGQNRTADLTYGDYEKDGTFYFPTYREITVAEKTKVDIALNFKQYQFNNELSFPFSIPKNYKSK